jgi:hypothetical protein
MRAKEFLVESDDIPLVLINLMKRKGYTQLGEPGADAAAFLEPGTGLVLKIFGTRDGSEVMTHDQMIFKEFADYCMANPNNPFLPQFFGWETFHFDGNTYLQIRMERLFEFTNASWGDQLEGIANSARYSNEPYKKQRYLDNVMDYDSDNYADDEGFEDSKDEENAGVELLTHLGTKGFNLLWDTIHDLAIIAGHGGFRLDLHCGNFMLGSDGEIVINDPFWSGNF